MRAREKEQFLKKDNVDWSQSRVIFISPQFTTYQRKAIEFKDLPIELWEVKKYSNNTILFNQIQAPEKSESITTISQKSEIVRKISQEIKVYTEDSHLEKAEENIKSIYKELHDIIISFGPSIIVKPTVKYIAFIRKKNFVDIVIYKSNITLFLNIKKGTLNDPKKIARDVSNIGHWGNGDYEMKVKVLVI
jgi:predicted transport protein